MVQISIAGSAALVIAGYDWVHVSSSLFLRHDPSKSFRDMIGHHVVRFSAPLGELSFRPVEVRFPTTQTNYPTP